MRRLLLTSVVLATSLGLCAQQSAAKKVAATKHPFLWRLEGKDRSNQKFNVWLYGTMHLGDLRLVTLPKVVDDALAQADALFCELDMKRAQKQGHKMALKMRLPRGESLKKILPEDLYAMADARLKKLGVSMHRFQRFQIWALPLLMAQLDAAKNGMTHSLDKNLFDEADADGLEVGGLESVEEQMNALSGQKLEDSIASLRHGLTYMDKLEAKGTSSLKVMLEAYLSGREDTLLDVVEESIGDPEVFERVMKPMLEDRNRRMTDRIIEKIEKSPKKKYFFAIGAMHFIGKGSMLEMLRQKGYQVRRLQPPTATWKDYVKLRVELLEARNTVKKLQKKLAGGK